MKTRTEHGEEDKLRDLVEAYAREHSIDDSRLLALLLTIAAKMLGRVICCEWRLKNSPGGCEWELKQHLRRLSRGIGDVARYELQERVERASKKAKAKR
jgi:hypothetical protein